MSMAEEMKRFETDLNASEELRNKLAACYEQLGGKADGALDDELMAKAAAALGYQVTDADFAKARAKAEELSGEDLDMVSGGKITIWCMFNEYCMFVTKKP